MIYPYGSQCSNFDLFEASPMKAKQETVFDGSSLCQIFGDFQFQAQKAKQNKIKFLKIYNFEKLYLNYFNIFKDKIKVLSSFFLNSF